MPLESYTVPAATAGLGIVLGHLNDQRQYEQAERLQGLQIKGLKEMGEFNYDKALDMWKATGIVGQKEQLELAGMNAALLYGMKGGGGVTTGPGGPSGVTGNNAPQGGQEIQQMTAMGLQLGLMQAQKKLLESQANKNNVEAGKIGGVDTAQTQAQTQLLAQELDNKREDFQIKRLQQTMMNLQNFEQQASQEDRLDYIEYQTKIAIKQLELIKNQVGISTATMSDQIKLIQQHAIGAALQNGLTSAQTGKTLSDIGVNQAQIQKWAAEIQQHWVQLGLNQENVNTAKKAQAVTQKLYELTGGKMKFDTLIQIAQTMTNMMESFKTKLPSLPIPGL